MCSCLNKRGKAVFLTSHDVRNGLRVSGVGALDLRPYISLSKHDVMKQLNSELGSRRQHREGSFCSFLSPIFPQSHKYTLYISVAKTGPMAPSPAWGRDHFPEIEGLCLVPAQTLSCCPVNMTGASCSLEFSPDISYLLNK